MTLPCGLRILACQTVISIVISILNAVMKDIQAYSLDQGTVPVQMMVKTKTTVLNLRQPTYTMG